MPGLGTTYGRGGATTAPSDLLNSDVILIMGSNMAENHPVGFQWVMEAKEKKGAHLIHVDPRFSRTSAVANTWVPLRAGSDILFLGGMINHILQNELDFREYVIHYTNASVIIPESFKDTEELGGIFSGWDPEKKQYDTRSWLYQGVQIPSDSGDQNPNGQSGGHSQHGVDSSTDLSTYEQDLTLQHPRCVYQIMKRHFARYTPEIVERYCGVSKEAFLNVANLYCGASGPEKTAAMCYALGWTQHSSGVQIIRCAAILQLLLGNMGRPGGGILALRGHASIQGSTDIPTLFDSLPGYLSMPKFGPSSKDLASFIKANKPRTGFWNNIDKYIVSLLKAYYGDAATKENDFGFNWLPRITGDHSHQAYWLDMLDGKMDGLFVIGQNPAVAGPNSGMERRGLGKLKWLVVREMVETETASFWYESPEVQRGDLRTEDIETEVFLMPGAGHVEKEGTFTNTQRLLQWREKAVDPPGDARSENWFIYHLWRRIVEKAKLDPSPRNQGLLALTMNYTLEGDHREPSSPEILQEINGWTVADHKLLSGFGELKADGSTLCGAWIYSGVFPSAGRNRANEREPKDEYGHGWGWAWPADRRVIYNRASARPDGSPWSERKKLVWWDEAAKKWTGKDVPDFTATKPPNYVPPPGAEGDAALAGDKPYILHADGFGWLWVPVGLNDGPLPTHYEPLESPVSNPLYPQRQANPVGLNRARPGNEYATSPDARFPYVLTTYRLTEHHTAGGMSRTLSHLAELQPEIFCEISMELANELKIEHGAWVTLVTARGAIEAHALSTSRIRPLKIGDRRVHQIGVPFHWGYNGLVKGDMANDLIAISEEPNVHIMETKGLLCNLLVGRRANNVAKLKEYHSIAEGKTA
ncbi:MAG TPA: molybdopterin-dependent oxidoreductase [Candidatus Binatus sp.]|nr:molybdopterin-dependent oxidoreductase [Candidatus Binatus sp.]